MDDIIRLLRKELNFTEEEISDEDLLILTKGTYLKAFVGFEVAINNLKSAIADEFIAAFNRIKLLKKKEKRLK